MIPSTVSVMWSRSETTWSILMCSTGYLLVASAAHLLLSDALSVLGEMVLQKYQQLLKLYRRQKFHLRGHNNKLIRRHAECFMLEETSWLQLPNSSRAAVSSAGRTRATRCTQRSSGALGKHGRGTSLSYTFSFIMAFEIFDLCMSTGFKIVQGE